MTAQNGSQNRGSGTLNVLLHGAFTFVVHKEKKQIRALIPDLKHAYRAGSWLGETEIRRGSYRLTGVKEGTAEFKPEQNLIVQLESCELHADAVPIVTLTFPCPEEITSLRVAEAPTECFRGKQSLLLNNGALQHMATLQVFTYHFEDENKLALEADDGGRSHYWEPAFTGNHINFHIFSSEDSYHKPSNALEDLNQCLELLGVKLSLDTRFLPAREIPGTDAAELRRLEVAPEETEPLAVRTRRMALLGRLITQKGDADVAWYGEDALDGDPTACADCVAIC